MGPILCKYNTALSGATRIPIEARLSATGKLATSATFTPATGDSKISIDGGAEANTGTALTWDDGTLYLTLSGAETTGQQMIVRIIDPDDVIQDEVVIVRTFGNPSAFYPTDYVASIMEMNATQIFGVSSSPLADQMAYAATHGGFLCFPNPVAVGTTQTGTTSSSVVLESSASAVDDDYNGRIVRSTTGTGYGSVGLVTDYTGSTRVCTVTLLSGPGFAEGDTYIVADVMGNVAGFRNVLADADTVTKIGRLDQTIGSRMATFTYTAPDNTGISTLLTRLSSDRAGYLDKLNVAGTLAHTGNASSFMADVSGLLTTSAFDTRLSSTRAGYIDNLNGHTPQTGDAYARIGALGAGLTSLPWNSAWDAEVQSEVQDAIEANHLDHLLAADYDPANKPGVATALLNELIVSDAGVSQLSTNALENAPAGEGGGGGSGDATLSNQNKILKLLQAKKSR